MKKFAFFFSFLLLLGYATASNASEWSIVYSVANTTPTFTDMNVFEWNANWNYTQEVDLNILSDFNIVFDFNVSGVDLNYNSMAIYYTLTHGEDDQNCFLNIRNEPFCGWKYEEFDFYLLDIYGIERHFLSKTEDDHAFKHSAYNLDPDSFETKGTAFNLQNQNTWVKTLITNAKSETAQTDSNIFFNYSFSANYIGTPNRNLMVYDCNSNVSTPVSNPSCNRFVFSSSTQKDLDGYYSILELSNDLNQIVADYNVSLNQDGNHWIYYNCPNCNTNQYWALDMINNSSNIDRERNWTTVNGLGNLSASPQTNDTHIHWQDESITHTFAWMVQMANNAGTDFNSQISFYQIAVENLPPMVLDLNIPIQGSTITGTTDINAVVSDPNQDVLTCDFYIFYQDGSLILYSLNNSVSNGVCGFSYDSTAGYDGNHFASVIVRETTTPELFYDDFNQSIGFNVKNNIISPLDLPAGETEKYVAPYDPRTIDSNRYFAPDDPRAQDSNRFYAPYDQRGEKVSVDGTDSSSRVTAKQQGIILDEKTIPLYLTLGVIILLAIGYLFFSNKRGF